MIKNSGKIHDQVRELLTARGYETNTLQIATLKRGTEHLVLLGGEIIGEFYANPRKRPGPGKLIIYADVVEGENGQEL